MSFNEFMRESKRVFRITRKPDKQEFMTVVKVSGLGILAIGLIGFVVHLIGEALKAIGL